MNKCATPATPLIPTYTDQHYADEIRQTVSNLNKLVNTAKAAGLQIDLKLHTIGTPSWIGYKDAVEIIRKY